jgi:hypothetical protein
MFGLTWVVMAVLFGYCLHLQSRLNSQSDWLMNHSAWLKSHSNWLKALTILHKLELPEGQDVYLMEALNGTPEDTIAASMDIADNQWVNE